VEEKMNIKQRKVLLAILDAFLVNIAFILGLLIRFEGSVPSEFFAAYYKLALPFTVVWLLSFYIFRLYHRLWKYASIGELTAIIGAVSVGTLANIALTYFITLGTDVVVPRSIFVLLWILNTVFIGGSRLGWRIFRDTFIVKRRVNGGLPILIVGAGDAGAMVAREIRNHYAPQFNPVGFIDDAPEKQGLKLLDIPVLGTREDIPHIVEEYAVQQIIIAIPSAPRKEIKKIVEICQETKAKVKILPGVYDLIDGKVSLKQIRDVEVEDLLGRDPVSVNLEEIAGYLKGRVVAVTGAGGSIGSELCRQIARFEPKELILLDIYENSLYDVQLELEYKYKNLKLQVNVADIKDKPAVEKIFKNSRPDVVFHAAAHKHVPLMENNPAEAVKNNIIGTKVLAELAGSLGIKIFVFISTDKAVNPTSVMGASKRVAEMVVQHYNALSSTKFAVVRFGNVLASKGSVIPIFKQQIARGGPVTVTHPEMTRYFMTISEAVQLVIQAGAMAKGGEIFVLDMGEPVKIVDLARTLIKLSGFEPEKDIEIVYTGIRPGEKLYEEILTKQEGIAATRHERIFVSKRESNDAGLLETYLVRLSKKGSMIDDEEEVKMLEVHVPVYRKFTYTKQYGYLIMGKF